MNLVKTPIDFFLNFPYVSETRNLFTEENPAFAEAVRLISQIKDVKLRGKYQHYAETLRAAEPLPRRLVHMPTYTYLCGAHYPSWVHYRVRMIEKLMARLLDHPWYLYERAPWTDSDAVTRTGGFLRIPRKMLPIDFPLAKDIAKDNIYFVATLQPTEVPETWGIAQTWHDAARKPARTS